MYPATGVLATKAVSEPFSPQLVEPSLQNRLRIVGRFIDSRHLYSIALNEIDQGFVVRAYTVTDHQPVLLEFAAEDFSTMIQDAIASRGERDWTRPARPLVPTGYEDLLRAFGSALDRKAAENIVVTEFSTFITVCGFAPVIESDRLTYQPFSDALGVSDVRALLDAAIGRRGSHAPITSYYPPGLRDPDPVD